MNAHFRSEGISEDQPTPSADSISGGWTYTMQSYYRIKRRRTARRRY